MKKVISAAVAATMILCGAAAMTGCGQNGEMLTTEANVGISQGVSETVGKYSEVAYFELERPEDVRINFEADKIQKVSYKYRVLETNEYSYRNDVIIIKKSVFENESAGDKRIRIFVGGKYVQITLRVVTKVIYNTEDFNSIRTNLNGVYVLGCDIDFGGDIFQPIGKAIKNDESTGIFEGIFDGMGYSVKNLKIQAADWAEGEDGNGQGPSLGGAQGNGNNYSNGIFMSTGGSAQIINTSFINISVVGYLSGSVVGSNGGIIKNCRVVCSLTNGAGGYSEHTGAIAGQNGSGDAAGRIENCIAVYSSSGGSRGIADWNAGIIKNSFAAVADDYVLHIGYDKETGRVPENFDYDDWTTQDNFETLFGNFTIPAFPGTLSWVDGVLTYYKLGDIINSDVVRKEYLMDPANFPKEDGWDRNIWDFTYGTFPTLKTQSR